MNNRIHYCLIAQEDCWLTPLIWQSVNDILVQLTHVTLKVTSQRNMLFPETLEVDSVDRVRRIQEQTSSLNY